MPKKKKPKQTRHFKVGTFLVPGRPLKKTYIEAYLRYYSPDWEGCVCFEVDALTGEAAKRLAIELRIGHEEGKQRAQEEKAQAAPQATLPSDHDRAK